MFLPRLWGPALAISAVLACAQQPPESPLAGSARAAVEVRVAQISDTHLGEADAPQAAENLHHVLELVNAQHPDVVVVTGDIGENPAAWDEARQLLRGANAPVYYVPGNHDVHTTDLARYRAVFGRDYYTFRVKDVTFVVIDSQLLGNYDQFGAPAPPPLPRQTERASQQMFDWMAAQAPKLARSGIVIGLQHIPVYRSADFPDPKPYWFVSEPYRSREIALLHAMNIHHVLAGHWHLGRVFEAEGITWHVGLSSSRLLWSGPLGFAMHTVYADGSIKTQFVDLNGNVAEAKDLGESPESLCKAEAGRSVRICQPGESTVASPFHVLANAHGNGLVKVIQIYVDGEKKFETAGDIMNTDLALPPGRHEFIVQGLDDDGFFKSTTFPTVQ